MIDLVIDPRDPELAPLGPSADGATYRPAQVTVTPSRVVRLTAGGFLWQGAPVTRWVNVAGDPVVVSVPATDGTEILEADRDTFEYVVTVETDPPGAGKGRDPKRVTFHGLLPTSLGATVNVTELINDDPASPVLAGGGGSAYASLSAPAVTTYAANRDASLDLNLTANSSFNVTGTKLGTIVGIRADLNGHTLSLPGGLDVAEPDPVTVTAWRMAEGWVYTANGVTSVEPVADVTAPTVGTLTSSAITSTGFTLTVTGASDGVALHAQPYRFSTDNGTTWSAWQTSAVFVVTGKSASTTYTARHEVRDAAGNTALGSSIVVTTSAPGADVTAPTAGTLAGSAISETGFTLTVTGAADETALHATPYAFSTDGGSTWSAYQSSAVFVVTGKTGSTGYTCQHRVRDAASNVSTGSSITVTTSAAPGVLAFQGESRTSSAVSSYTYTAAPIGTASATRRVVVAVTFWAAGNRVISSLTVGGVAATKVYDTSPGVNFARGFILYTANIPTGTTADVVATFNGTVVPSIAVWSATQSVTFVAGSFTDTAATATDCTVSAASSAGGFAIAGFNTSSSATSASAWTNITERWEDATNQPTSGGDMTTATTTASATVTWTPGVTAITRVGIGTFAWA